MVYEVTTALQIAYYLIFSARKGERDVSWITSVSVLILTIDLKRIDFQQRRTVILSATKRNTANDQLVIVHKINFFYSSETPKNFQDTKKCECSVIGDRSVLDSFFFN